MTFEKVATCNIQTSEWAALKWLQKGSGFWTELKESQLGEKATKCTIIQLAKDLSRQKLSLSWQGKSKKGLELDSLKPSSTSIWPCVCQKDLEVVWTVWHGCHLYHVVFVICPEIVSISIEYLDYMEKKKPKFIMSNIEIMCYTGWHRSGSLLM
jgi:hypothetical protein